MDISSLNLVYFSPTKTTAKVVNSIGKGTGFKLAGDFNFTLPCDVVEKEFGPNDLVVFGIPVYGGRVPLPAVDRINSVRGNNTPAVLVAVYGNRAYEDALIELKDMVVRQGFRPVAAAAFIGEHSFATEELPTANGRPDIDDLDHGAGFGRQVAEKIKGLGSVDDLDVPGNRPYKDRSPKANMCPETDEEKCVKCGECVDLCPTSAISLEGEVVTDGEACVFCSACVKFCPEEARVWTAPKMFEMRNWLNSNCPDHKQPEYFL